MLELDRFWAVRFRVRRLLLHSNLGSRPMTHPWSDPPRHPREPDPGLYDPLEYEPPSPGPHDRPPIRLTAIETVAAFLDWREWLTVIAFIAVGVTLALWLVSGGLPELIR